LPISPSAYAAPHHHDFCREATRAKITSKTRPRLTPATIAIIRVLGLAEGFVGVAASAGGGGGVTSDEVGEDNIGLLDPAMLPGIIAGGGVVAVPPEPLLLFAKVFNIGTVAVFTAEVVVAFDPGVVVAGDPAKLAIIPVALPLLPLLLNASSG
jgi:hypothetical protein